MRSYFRRLTNALGPLIILTGLLVRHGCLLQGAENEARGVQLVLSTKEIAPTTTFELRFDEPMVAYDRVGLVAPHSPLVIAPSLKGSFVWLSQRSGVFTPSEPPALGTTYELSLPNDLRNAMGQPSSAKLSAEVRTPPMSVTQVQPSSFQEKDAPSDPKLVVQFNVRVKPEALIPFVRFRDAAGKTLPALLQQAKENDEYFDGPENAQPAWRDRFRPPAEATPAPNESKYPALVPNRVVIRPAQPLSIGPGWHCVLQHGIPAADGPERLPSDYDIKIGDVRPFTIEGIEPHNTIDDGRWLRVGFNKSISPLLKSAEAAKWVAVSPAPNELRYETSGSSISIYGRFDLEQHYLVSVRAGLPAAELFTLDKPFQKDVAFTLLPPRLYFPALTTAQVSGGRRAFELRAVNLAAARVRAKLLERDSIIYALAGYKNAYEKKSNAPNAWLEPYRGVPFELVPGKIIFEKQIDVSAARDEPRVVALSWDELLAGRRTGAVFLEADRAENSLGTQALVQLTDIGLVWKCNKTDAWIYVFSHETGQPIPGATVRLLTDDSQTLVEQKTDAHGVASLGRDEHARWLLAENGNDFHAIEFGKYPGDAIPLYAFHIPFGYWDDGARVRQRMFLFCDRPVYQPGDTIHLKGMVRESDGGALTLPGAISAHLSIRNPDDEKVWEKDVALSRTGTFAEDIPLARGRVGAYAALLDLGQNATQSLSFRVEEYKPNAFETSIAMKDSYPPNESVSALVTAKYYMGKPLAHAPVRWSLQGRDSSFAPEGFDDFTFGPANEDEEASEATVLSAHGETRLADDGTATIAPEVPTNPKKPQPRQCDLLVEISDLGQQTISERKQFVRQSSDFYLGHEALDRVALVNEELPINLAAVQADGRPQPGTVSAQVVIEKLNYHTVRELGAGGAPTYRTETTYTPVWQQTVATAPLEKSGARWKLAATSAAHFTPNEVGSYRLRATAQDSGGHPVETDWTFSVAAQEPQRTAWDYRNEAQIDLVADKTSYLPGEQATILVKTPISGAALVSIEQERVRRSFVAKLEGNAPTVRVPIEASDAPNVFVSLVELRGRAESPRQIKSPDYRIGYVQLNVVRPETKLQVAVESHDRSYRPGAEITAEVRVKAPRAEVALYAVDEAVLSLMGYKTPDPFSFFYKTEPLRVQTGLTLPSLFPEDVSALTFSNKGFLIGGGGAEPAPPNLRKNFLATAFWKADLATDANGTATARFTAPDNLTRFRLIAVANAGADRFGSSDAAFEVNKPLMLEPALPRFANVGDKVIARAVVHNRSPSAGEAEIALRLDDKTKERGTLVRRLTMTAGASQAIDFPLEFQNAGEAKWIWTAKLGENSDAVETKLPVGFPAPVLQEVLLDRTNAREKNLLAGANPQFLEGAGKFAARIANTRLSGLSEAVKYLLEYPYGCAEQTVSSMLPWLVAPELRKAIPELDAPNEKIERAINHGIDRLLTMQTAEGGLSFWPNETRPMLWPSAYGGVALALAQRTGHALPAATLDRLYGYLSAQLRNSAELRTNAEMSDHCLALYALALAGRPEQSYHELFFNQRNKLSSETRAVLALAILESHGPAAMIEELLNPQTPLEPQGDVWFGNGERELAVRLLAWSQFRPNDRAVDAFVEELLRARHNGRWETTQSNAWALLALTKYAAQVETGDKRVTGALQYDSSRTEFQLDDKSPVFEEEQSLPAMTPGASPAPLTLFNPDARTLFTQVKLEARPRVALQPRQDRGFALQRSYNSVNDDGSLGNVSALRVGDRVLVTLRFEVRQPAHYVALADALPSIFEAVNPEFKTQETRANDSLTSDWVSDYRELRSDRALFFRNHLPPGNYTVRYLARVRAAGEAIAPAAKIEEMYHPEHFGLSEAIPVKSGSLQ